VLVIMLLLPSTGARHPYKIDGKYLKKRNVTVDDMDPYNINVYTLKELIWRDWREGKSSVHFIGDAERRYGDLYRTAWPWNVTRS
jgi:hypothetical protein